MLIFVTIVLFFLVLAIGVNTDKTKRFALLIMKEIDVLPITGGERRVFIGGIITVLYLILLLMSSCGILVKYFMYNERIEATELANVSKN